MDDRDEILLCSSPGAVGPCHYRECKACQEEIQEYNEYKCNDEYAHATNSKLLKYARQGDLQQLRGEHSSGKVDVNYQSIGGYTAVMWASWNGHAECLELLIQLKADINRRSRDGCTALTLASKCGHVACVKLLLANKAILTYPTCITLKRFPCRNCAAEVSREYDSDERFLGMPTLIDTNDFCRCTVLHTPAMTLRCVNTNNKTAIPVLGFLLLACNAEPQEEDMLEFSTMKTRIEKCHKHLEDVLSSAVIVDTRIMRNSHGLYHEPLERVLQYCGLEVTTTTTTISAPIPRLLGGDRKERVSSAWYWWNQFHSESANNE